MIIFLTSNLGGQYNVGGQRVATSLNNENGLVNNLKLYWKKDSRVLLIGASPSAFDLNDSIKNILEQSFPMSDLSIEMFDVCDDRNENLVQKISEYDVAILSGGHVPTQNEFFQKIKLRDVLNRFDGILIGISAGTMNAAEIVYAQPELEGESVDPQYQRFLIGLGITNLMILPHYQDVKNDILDEKRVIEDITFPDSYGREFYALVDGSYVLIESDVRTLYGESYLIKDGTVKRICKINERICLVR